LVPTRRILIYYEQRGYGGVDTHLAHLINHWPQSGDQFIVVSNPDNEGLTFLKQLLRNPSVRIITLDQVFARAAVRTSKVIRAYNYLNKQLRFVKLFKKLIAEEAPDIILSNNGGYPGGITNWLAAIISKQSQGQRNHTFLLVHHAPTSKISGIFAVLVNVLVWWIKYLEVSFITVSQASKSNLEAYTLMKKMHVIYNGIEIKDLRSESFDFKNKWNIGQEKILVGIIGPIDPHKGHATLIEIFKQSRVLQKKAHLVVVGSGREQLVENLKKIVEEFELDGIVTFTGFIHGDSHVIIGGFDLLVMPTVDFEGFGYSIAEGMGAGVPVVASRVGALPEIIVDGESGYLVEPSDISRWRVTIEKLVGNPALRKHIGMAGKQRIESRFSAESMSQQYYNLLTANEIL